MDMGLGLVPEDRKRHGLVLSMTAKENITLPTLGRLASLGWVNSRGVEMRTEIELSSLVQWRMPGTDLNESPLAMFTSVITQSYSPCAAFASALVSSFTRASA